MKEWAVHKTDNNLFLPLSQDWNLYWRRDLRKIHKKELTDRFHAPERAEEKSSPWLRPVETAMIQATFTQASLCYLNDSGMPSADANLISLQDASDLWIWQRLGHVCD